MNGTGGANAIRFVRFEPERHLRFVASWFAEDPAGAGRLDGFYARADGWSEVLLCDPRRTGLLATWRGAPAGFVDLEVQPEYRTANVACYVARAYRRRGLCVAMLRAAADPGALGAAGTLQASVEPDNAASIRCLERARFVRVGPDGDGLIRYAKAPPAESWSAAGPGGARPLGPATPR